MKYLYIVFYNTPDKPPTHSFIMSGGTAFVHVRILHTQSIVLGKQFDQLSSRTSTGGWTEYHFLSKTTAVIESG